MKQTKKSFKKIIISVIAVIAAIALVVVLLPKDKAPVQSGQPQYRQDTAQLRDLTSSLTDSGSLEPANSYTVISLVSGEIMSASFETGDVVSKDDVLYLVDASDATSNIERAENTLEQRQKSYDKVLKSKENLTITAPINGTISGFSIQTGAKVNNGSMVATIEDTNTLLLTEYYSDEYISEIRPGMSATVSVPDQMLTLKGSVKEVHTLRRLSPTGVSCFAVTVQVANPGSLSLDSAATCWLQSASGEIYPTITDEDGFEAIARKTVSAEVSGTADATFVRNGEIVQAGQILVKLSSDTIDDEITSARDNLRDAELSLDDRYDALDNYTIKAPIDGTIIEKFYKTGENAETGKTLCTIFDLSSLTVTLYVDELDIGDVSVGQRARVTSDSLAGVVYEGRVTEVSINGTASGGVTTYPVKVQIDETDGLLPGMNVDVAILISDNPGVLTIPADAVQTGGRVLVKTADGSTGEGAPDGYQFTKVELGVSDGTYVQILSGLSEGEEITWQTAATSNSFSGMMPGGMGMGMGMPMGGMTGQMRPTGSGTQMRPTGGQMGGQMGGNRTFSGGMPTGR